MILNYICLSKTNTPLSAFQFGHIRNCSRCQVDKQWLKTHKICINMSKVSIVPIFFFFFFFGGGGGGGGGAKYRLTLT